MTIPGGITEALEQRCILDLIGRVLVPPDGFQQSSCRDDLILMFNEAPE